MKPLTHESRGSAELNAADRLERDGGCRRWLGLCAASFVLERDQGAAPLRADLGGGPYSDGQSGNHHADPTSARHGLAWYEIDMSWWAIRFLEIAGLAKSVHVASMTLTLQTPGSKKELRAIDTMESAG